MWHTLGVDVSDRDVATVRFPPPLIYVGAVIVGLLFHEFAVPLSLEFGLWVRVGVAGTAGLLGLILMIGAVGLFKRTGQDPKPWKTTPEIISTGVYRFTRNPMYASMALLQIGIGVGLANGWIVAVVPLVLIIIYVTAIRHEEAYLERKFGDPYVEYKKSVRRWI